MFRPTDLVTRAFETDDGPYIVVAPVASRTAALANLYEALPRLCELFEGETRLRGYTDVLADAIQEAPGEWVTIEWDEIAVITDGDFLAQATAAMASLEPATIGDPEVDRARLLALSGITRSHPPFPAPRSLNPPRPVGVPQSLGVPQFPDDRGIDALESIDLGGGEDIQSHLIGVGRPHPVLWEV